VEVSIVDYQSPEAAAQFVESIKGTGFGVLTNHPITHELIDKVYSEWKAFFALPQEEKEKYLFKRDFEVAQDGFFPTRVGEVAKGFTARDIKEFYHYYPAVNDLPEMFTSATKELRAALITMAERLLDWLEAGLPKEIAEKLSMSLKEMMDKEVQTLLRVLHYPPLPESIEEGAIRAAAHEDINLITLLVSASAPGLEVQDVDGNWHVVPCCKDSIAVNVGDMLQEATGFYYKATKHRVVNPTGPAAKESRFSIPLFLHGKDEVVLSDRYTVLSYRNERLKELGLM
jgi:isopenicillin N synthase-like dioxygenase